MIDKLGLLQPSVFSAPQRVAGNGATDLGQSFGETLQNALNNVSAQEAKVDRLNENFVAGNSADVHQLLIESEKASLGLQLTVQVRNKVIEAYQEVMRMQI